MLTKCSKCGTWVSDKAAKCPNCGFAFARIPQPNNVEEGNSVEDETISELKDDPLGEYLKQASSIDSTLVSAIVRVAQEGYDDNYVIIDSGVDEDRLQVSLHRDGGNIWMDTNGDMKDSLAESIPGSLYKMAEDNPDDADWPRVNMGQNFKNAAIVGMLCLRKLVEEKGKLYSIESIRIDNWRGYYNYKGERLSDSIYFYEEEPHGSEDGQSENERIKAILLATAPITIPLITFLIGWLIVLIFA